MSTSPLQAQANALARKFPVISTSLFRMKLKCTHSQAYILCCNIWHDQAHEWFKWRMENK